MNTNISIQCRRKRTFFYSSFFFRGPFFLSLYSSEPSSSTTTEDRPNNKKRINKKKKNVSARRRVSLTTRDSSHVPVMLYRASGRSHGGWAPFFDRRYSDRRKKRKSLPSSRALFVTRERVSDGWENKNFFFRLKNRLRQISVRLGPQIRTTTVWS